MTSDRAEGRFDRQPMSGINTRSGNDTNLAIIGHYARLIAGDVTPRDLLPTWTNPLNWLFFLAIRVSSLNTVSSAKRPPELL